MISAADLAETFTEAASQNYADDGHLAPTLVLLAKSRRYYLMLGPSDDVPKSAAICLMGLAAAAQPDFAVLISEVWKSEEPTPEAFEDYERGELERREQSGDPNVFTALMVFVLDCKRFESSHTILTVDHGDRLDREYATPGLGEGRVPELLVSAYENGLHMEPPTFDVAELCRLLGNSGLITAVATEED